MCAFQYQPLDLTSDAVRLVRLKKGLTTDPIECELIEAYLHGVEGIPYEALSYTWGDPSNPAEIKVNGQKARVRNNLYVALHCLRSGSLDRVLWIDAVSINQDDNEEKTHQVGQMRRVYENAENVLVWLGPGGRDSDRISLLMELATQLDKRLLQAGSTQTCHNEWKILLEEMGGTQTEFFKQRCDALQSLLERPWFRRIWIIQEVASARSATVVCGWYSAPGRTFARLPALMGVDTGIGSQAILDLMISRRQSRMDWRTAAPDITTLLTRFKTSEAHDPRDKIYALLGIASDTRESTLHPNYNITAQQAVRNTISYLLFKQVLDSSVEFPSWNVDQFFQVLDRLPEEVCQWGLKNCKLSILTKFFARPDYDINAELPEIGIPLCFLASSSNPDTEAVILAALNLSGSKVNIENKQGKTPVELAVESGRRSIVELLLKRGADLRTWKDRSALWLAAQSGRVDIIKLLADHGALIDDRELEHLSSPLSIAAENGYTDAVQYLISKGAHINKRGDNPLLSAARSGNLATARLLLDNGAHINTTTTYKKPLIEAVRAGHVDIVRELIARGVELRTEAMPAMIIAARHGHAEILQLFRNAGGKIDLQWKDSTLLADEIFHGL